MMVEQEFEKERQRRLRAAHRAVVKLGTNVVTGAGDEICANHIEPLVRSIAALSAAGRQIVLVSSGAVGLGAGRLGLHRSRLRDLVTRQACAAVGQSLLMYAYERLFRVQGVRIAQVLLTEEDFTDRGRYTNLRRTMEKLLKLGVLPIVNENDTVSTSELAYVVAGKERVFGDNDRLAALVMSKLDAHTLILLSNVEGLLRRNSKVVDRNRTSDESIVIPFVEEITPEIQAMAAGPSVGGRGGMRTKLDAAQMAMRAGGMAVIANGTTPDILERIFNGEQVGTTFMSTSRLAGKRRWIAYAAIVKGRLIVNAGAHHAIINGKASLLSSGVVGVEEQFAPQDVVAIADFEGREFARGIVDCASAEVRAVVESRAEASTGSHVRPRDRVLVKRDNIVLLEK